MISFDWNGKTVIIEIIGTLEIGCDNMTIDPLWFMNQLSIGNTQLKRIK